MSVIVLHVWETSFRLALFSVFQHSYIVVQIAERRPERVLHVILAAMYVSGYFYHK